MKWAVFIFYSFFCMSVLAASSYRINHGANQSITEFATCKTVTNSHASADYFVPTNSSAEWSAFYTNPPLDVTIGACGGGPETYTFTYNSGTGKIRITKSSDSSFVDLATTVAGNGWFADWVAPNNITSVLLNGAGGGGGGVETWPSEVGGSGGTGGYSALATTATPAILIYQAAGGNGGYGETTNGDTETQTDPEDGFTGARYTIASLNLSAVSYRVYIGRGGGGGQRDFGDGASYSQGAGGTAGLGAPGGFSAFTSGGYDDGDDGAHGSIVIVTN